MRPARRLALVLGCAACATAFAQAPSAPTPPAPTPTAEDTAEAAPEQERVRERGPRAARPPRVFTVTWEAPEVLRTLFVRHLPPPKPEEGERRAGSLRPWIRDVRRKVPEIAASEGYFAATVDIEYADESRSQAIVKVTPGPRTTVSKVEIAFKGDLAGEGPAREKRRRALEAAWAMPRGTAFRSADWDVAKTRIAEELVEEDYAAGELVDTVARVDVESAKAELRLVLDSGPPFTLGEVRIEGIKEYPEAIIRRVVDFQPGERYSARRLQELQRRLQAGPWFSSVVIDVPRERDQAERAPVLLTVTERPRAEVGLAGGYGTDDGARAEVAYRYRDLFDRGLDLQSSLRISQERQIGYADVYLPPGMFPSGTRFGTIPFQDSVGALVEHSTFENYELTRFAVAGYRHFKLDNFETRVGLSYQIENSRPEGAEERIKRALAPIVAVTWRHVDNIFDPKRGGVLSLQLAAGSKNLASGDDFLKAYAQYQYWIPISPRDQLILRTEVGRTFTDHRERIPEDFLYRAGGSRSNRGYAFQSLGVEEGQAIVGGRYMATGTVEYVRWLNDTWGAAAFVDVGDATDSTGDWKANQSYGIGARFKTPAGPFALDLAYAEGPRKFRLAFSVTVAF